MYYKKLPTAPRLFFLIWNGIGFCVIIMIMALLIEWFNHEASWDGVYKAHIKHLKRANTQLEYSIND
jgi:hypothetical protein